MAVMEPKDTDPIAFIESLDISDKKKTDAFKLLDLFGRVTGLPAVMWGPSIIGYGSYHYVYDSGHSGDAPKVGFSPRKSALTLYVATDNEGLYDQLGKHRRSKACLYINKLQDVDLTVVEQLVKDSITWTDKRYPDSK